MTRKEYEKEWHKKRTQARIDAGLCKICGKVPPLPGIRYCEVCREKQIGYRKKRDENEKKQVEIWKAEGLCTKCGEPVLPGYTVCERHYVGYMPKAQEETKKEQKDTISEINAKAREMGLSYGKYQLLRQQGLI